MISIILFSILLFWNEVRGERAICLRYNGSGFSQYNLNNADISERATYKLTFKTTTENGLLLFAKGSHDYEALFIRDGILHYFLFNPTPHGSGGTFGGQFESNHRVNNNTWITVEVFRNKKPRRERFEKLTKTGLIISSEDGKKERHVSTGRREGIQIIPPVFIGGYRENLGRGGEKFQGIIKDVHEKVTNYVFKEPVLLGGKRCVGAEVPAQ
ncbi:hypothetical protein SNE40_023494 [Patella caerulea]|uniref:Laminin G domain-containing protein n=1 Tax=Patella caerulea TaxID=87958 RepID=A0AAN8G7B1_PATCE